jgi:hypothetical protein
LSIARCGPDFWRAGGAAATELDAIGDELDNTGSARLAELPMGADGWGAEERDAGRRIVRF